MKKTILISVLALMGAAMTLTAGGVSTTEGEEKPEIKFDTLVMNMGTFSESDGPQTCTFGFTNVGTTPLIINQAYASCGCTVATYTKTPVQPGERGEVNVKYNGKGKYPGHFKKTVSIRSNAKNEVVRLTIEGNMTGKK